MKDYVIINGVSSKTKTGLAINILPPITKPEMRTLVEEIDGRDGDIITKLGYSAYDKTIEIGLFGNGYDVDDIIAFFNKEGTIVFSNEPTKYYNFTLVDSFDIERLLQFKTSTITFHCQPFKYEVGETPKEIEYDYVNGEGTEITLNNTDNALMQLELNPSELTQATRQYITIEWEQGEVAGSTGQDVPNDNSIRTKGYTRVYPNVLYKMSRTLTERAMNFRFYDISYNYIGSQAVEGIVTTNKPTNRMEIGDSSIDLTINNTSVAYMRMVDYNNNLSIVYTTYTDNTPSPDYPQEVQVIKGNNSIKIENKNKLIPPTNQTIAWGTRTISITDGYFDITGTGGGLSPFITLENQYTIKSNDYLHLFNNQGTFNIIIYDSNETQIAELSVNETNKILNLSSYAGQTIAKIKIYINATYHGDKTFTFSPMIVNNISTATDYVAHQEQVLPLNLPVENIFESTLTEKTVNNVTFTPVYENDKLQYINVNGTASADTRVALTQSSIFTLIQGKDYTLTGCPKGGSNSTYCLYINLSGQTETGNGLSFTRTSSTANTNISIDIKSGTVCNNLHFKPMIENSLIVNSYTPYGTTPIEYCKIGTYEDEFEHNGDKWYLNKYIGKSIFTGANTESWNKETVDGKPNYYINISTAKGGNTNPIMCNIGIYGGSVIGDGNNHKCYILNGKNLNYRCDEITTLENFRTMLGNTNMVVYYQLATPTHDEITDSTLINQLNAIEQAVSYDKQTNISQTNADLPFIIKATAMLSGSDEVEIVNHGNTYAKPVLDIKGSGIINVYLNGTQMFSVNITDEIVVDIANLESYNPNTSALMNRNVTGNISNFIIPVGTNTITVDGAVEKVTITMYQRWL